jgi:hypothetical protein
VVSPDGQNLDNFYLARPGADDVQLDLFGDYRSRRDNPRAAVRFLDTGHFALETHAREIGDSIREFLK